MATPNHVLAKIERRAAAFLNSRPFKVQLQRPIVSCTFDDFAASAWHVGGPVMAAREALGTYYACGGLLGSVLSDIPLANADDLQATHDAGHEIGCHTRDHVCLQGTTAREIEHQFTSNQKVVESLLPGYQMRTFAYPYGATGLVGKRATSRRFEAARGVWRGINHGKVDLMQLRTHSVPEAGRDLAAARELVGQTKRLNGWLVLYTHDVTENPSEGGCTPEQLATVLDVARDAGCDLLPVCEALTVVAATATSVTS